MSVVVLANSVCGGGNYYVRKYDKQMQLWACTLCGILLNNHHALLLPTAHSVHGGRPFGPDDPGLH